MSALSRNEHKSELPKPKVTVGKKFEPKPNSKMVPSYMRATTSSKKVIKNNFCFPCIKKLTCRKCVLIYNGRNMTKKFLS